MNEQPTRIAAFLAAAAFLSAPCFAQDAPTPEAPPVIAAPPVQTPPPEEDEPTVEAPPAPAPATKAPAQEASPADARPRPAPPRSAAPTAPATQAPAPAETFAPAPGPAPASEGPLPTPGFAPPLPTEVTVQPLPAPSGEPVPPTKATPRPERSILPWILAGALVLGTLAVFALRRPRRRVVYEKPYRPAPAAAAPPPAMILPTGHGDRPWLELLMKPTRAGVEGDAAMVEFVLTVDNFGSAPAEQVRISTRLIAAGPDQGAEMERALIEPTAEAALPSAIASGESKSIQTQVALPTAGLPNDTILPVVVADARYALPDGGEGRTSALFAVGVPDGEELAHFSIQNPSGLHEGVIARPLGEPERA